MPLIEITEKNKNQFGGKCVVLQSHIHDKHEVQPGDIVMKNGMDYFEAKKCKLVRDYDPALDEDDPVKVQDQVQEEELKKPLELKPELELKKLGPKKRTRKAKT
jgi:hypothetical protein